MSYDIIKSIKVKDGKVYIRCASNNVTPKTFEEWESNSLSKILQERGQEALDVEILNTYAGGSFQRGNNKYTRALEVLRHFPEYYKFDWRNNWEGYKKNGESEEYYNLLKKALKTFLPKQKFIIMKNYFGNLLYGRKTKRFMKWYGEKEKATRYSYKEDAEFMKKCFTNAENWEVLAI